MRAERLTELASRLEPLGAVFADSGFSLYLVGGIVRDAILGSLPPIGDPLAGDYDLTTEARPDDILRLVRPLASALWTQGERFGTIGATIDDKPLEITTHRAEVYDPESRQPTVSFGDDLETDLSRRDFTINAIALSVPAGRLVDPFRGRQDLADRVLRTPLDPTISFSDDPLRMLRAARFIPRFGLDADPELIGAARRLADRLDIVSVERVHDEFERLLGVDDPLSGLEFALVTGLLDQVFGPGAGPWLKGGIRLVRGSAELTERRARFLAPCGLDGAGQALNRLRYSTADRRQTLRILRTTGLLADADTSRPTLRGAMDDPKREPSDNVASVRSAIAIGSDLYPERADRFAEFGLLLDSMVDDGDTGPFTGPLDGRRLMEEFGLDPGPQIGELTRRQKELIIERGEVDETEVLAALRGDLGTAEEC